MVIIKKINDLGVLSVLHDVMKLEGDANHKFGVALYKQNIDAGRNFPLHWHDYIELEIILSGTVKHVYNDREFILQRGDAYMMCNYDFHELAALTNVVLYSVHFDKKLIAPEIARYLDYHKFHCCFDEPGTVQMVHKIEELKQEKEENMPFQTVRIKNLVNDLAISMFRKSSRKELQPAPLPVQQMISYLHEHFMEPLTLEAMARQLSFSPNYLGAVFKNQMGCTFHEYLNLIRLKHACSLLHSSDLSVKEIADAAGYRSVEYFLYVFKRKMMTTPVEYRKKQKME